MKRKILPLLLAFSLFLMPLSAVAENDLPEEETNQETFSDNTENEEEKNEDLSDFPQLCRAYLIGEPETGDILESFNIDELMEIASISKLMTYYLVKDAIKDGDLTLDTPITISSHAAEVGGSSLYMMEGDVFDVQTLLDGMMIVSANDAATALGEAVAGSEEAFAQMMTAKAEEINMGKVHFINASGMFDEEEDQNKATPRGLFVLAQHLVQNYPEILDYKNRTDFTVPGKDVTYESTMALFTVYPGVDGLKTGYTEDAGYCLVNTVNMDQSPSAEDDYRLITIVMGSWSLQARSDLTVRLMDYAREKYHQKEYLSPEIPFDTVQVPNGNDTELPLMPERSFKRIVTPQTTISFQPEIKAIELPVKTGDELGFVEIYEEGRLIDTITLFAGKDIEPADSSSRVKRFFNSLKEEIQLLWKYTHS